MKPTTYALLAALTFGAAPILAATAQQATGRHTSKASLNIPATLATVRVVAKAARPLPPINRTPVELAPVHIVADRGGVQRPGRVEQAPIIPMELRATLALRIATGQLRTTMFAVNRGGNTRISLLRIGNAVEIVQPVLWISRQGPA